MNIKLIAIALTLSTLTTPAYAKKNVHHLLDDIIELATLQEITINKTFPQALSMKGNKVINLPLMLPKMNIVDFSAGGHHE